MNRYTIYCTEEQARKALALGAPITQSQMIDIIRDEIGKHCFLQESDAYWFPTAEQMLGWLNEKGIALDIHTYFGTGNDKIHHYQFTVTDSKRIFNGEFPSHKETVLAAINAALDYLIDDKK